MNTELLTRKQASRYIGVSVATLANWASTKLRNIPYIKVGRLVKYRQTDLDAWLESRTVRYEED